MPAAANPRHRRRWLAAALVALTAPVLAVGGSPRPAYAGADQQHLSQLRHDASHAADDIGVRDAAAQQAALALAEIRTRVGAAERALATANHDLQTAQAALTARRAALSRAQSVERVAQLAVTAATARYDAAREQIRVMLRAAYEQGVGGDLDALMEGGSPDDLASRVGLLDRLSATRQHRLTALGLSRDELTRKQNTLTAARGRASGAVLAADTQLGAVSAAHIRAQVAAAQLVALQHDQEGAVRTAKAAAAGARKRYSQLQAASLRLQQILAARAAAERAAAQRAAQQAVAQRAAQQAVAQQAAAQQAAAQHAAAQHAVRAAPLSGDTSRAPGAGGLVMPTTGVFSSGFGYRDDPFGLGRTFHAGQDIAAATGTPIIAATAGTVAIVETPDESGGYGNYTCIDRGAGFATCYGHQSVVDVHVGQVVAQGQLIGLVGSTGESTGPHLHFEVRLNGVPVDPVPYLP